MKWLNRISSLFFMGFCVLIMTSSLKLGVGNFNAPGPGFMGFLSSILLLCLSLIIFAEENVRSRKEEIGGSFGWGNFSTQFIVMVALCVFAFFLEVLGFLLSSFILMSMMLLTANPRKWVTHLLVAFVVVNVSYLIFCKLLRVVLPAGIFRIQW